MNDFFVVMIVPPTLFMLFLIAKGQYNERDWRKQKARYEGLRDSVRLLRKLHKMLIAGVPTSNRNFKKVLARFHELEALYPQ